MGFESRLYVLEPVTVQVFLLIGKFYFMVVVVVVVVVCFFTSRSPTDELDETEMAIVDISTTAAGDDAVCANPRS